MPKIFLKMATEHEEGKKGLKKAWVCFCLLVLIALGYHVLVGNGATEADKAKDSRNQAIDQQIWLAAQKPPEGDLTPEGLPAPIKKPKGSDELLGRHGIWFLIGGLLLMIVGFVIGNKSTDTPNVAYDGGKGAAERAAAAELEAQKAARIEAQSSAHPRVAPPTGALQDRTPKPRQKK